MSPRKHTFSVLSLGINHEMFSEQKDTFSYLYVDLIRTCKLLIHLVICTNMERFVPGLDILC